MNSVGIVDYGLGNLRSVAGAVARAGFEPVITNEPKLLDRMDKLILPGVGAFGDGMKNLRELGLIPVLHRLVKKERIPILGICLGFQLMARQSEEFGSHKGIGWLDAAVVKMETDRNIRLPHVGWNDLYQVKECPLFGDIPEHALFYYVHSYHVSCSSRDVIVGECEYGIRFTAAVRDGNIFGTQFHPEKSQKCGLRLLENFLTHS